jgi:hypothetical protein
MVWFALARLKNMWIAGEKKRCQENGGMRGKKRVVVFKIMITIVI